MPVRGPGIVSLGSRKPGLTIFKSAAAPAFDPTTYGTVLAYWTADAGVLDASGNPITNGTKAKTWQDQSGNGHHAVQSTVGLQPTWAASWGNSKPALTFASSLLVATLTYTQPNTVIWVGDVSDATASGRNAFDGTGNRQALSITDGSGLNKNWSLYAGSALIQMSTVITPARHVLSMVFNGASSTLRVDGSAAETVSGTPGSQGISGSINIGAFNSSTGMWPGNYGALVIYSGVMSTANQTAAMRALGTKFGITVA